MTLARLALVYAIAVTACIALLPCPYHDDDVAHYLIARDALHEPALLLNIWGRPGFTVLHVLPAQLGFVGSRAFSALLTLAAGLACAAACRRFGPRASMFAFAACVFQPYAFHLADGALTETVFALSLALAILAFERGRIGLGALAMSWGAISRLEAIPMLVVAAAWIVVTARRDARSWRSTLVSLALLGAFPFLWNLGCAARTGFSQPFALLTDNVFINAENSAYGSGSPFRYIGLCWEIHGPVIAALAIVGCIALWRRGAWFAPAYVAAFYVLQSVLWGGGFFRTGGYHRFFASIAPAVAVAAAAGLVAFDAWRRSRGSRPIRLAWPIAVSVVWAAAHVATYHTLSDPHYRAVEAAVGVARDLGAPSPARALVSNSPYPELLLEGDPAATSIRTGHLESLATAPVGTIALITAWDNQPAIPTDTPASIAIRETTEIKRRGFAPYYVIVYERTR